MEIDPQANAWFMWAAYSVSVLILGGYGLVLWRRSRRVGGGG
jgi:hypothetical protein